MAADTYCVFVLLVLLFVGLEALEPDEEDEPELLELDDVLEPEEDEELEDFLALLSFGLAKCGPAFWLVLVAWSRVSLLFLVVW
ncbi:MAG TPA: hypothetical protein VHB72_02025 [Candidatus Saccharimonadales bacterium]|nr:hypothetical protein [Candidatus Saccharimonadales bacterium]